MVAETNNRHRVVCAFLLAVTSGVGWGAPEDAFEVASIKPSPPLSGDFGAGAAEASRAGMIVNASRASFTREPLRNLIARAYRVEPFRVSGPGWMDTARFDVVATLPKGAALAAVPDMLRTLLMERFALKTHLIAKETQCYVLAMGGVGGKAPAKRTDLTAEELKTAVPVAMDQLAIRLSKVMEQPVVDQTGFDGAYLFSRDFTMGLTNRFLWKITGRQAQFEAMIATPSEGDIVKAINAAGLRLEAQKLALTSVIIDHVDQMPTEN